MIGKKKNVCKGDIGQMKAFRIKNIKSFRDSEKIELKPMTIFVGKNSCGKSSLLRFPIVLAQTALSNTDSPVMFYGKMIDYGNYEDVVCGRKGGHIEFEIHYDINIEDVSDSRFKMNFDIPQEKNVKDVWLQVTLNRQDKKVIVESTELYIEDKCLSGFYREGDGYRININYYFKDGELFEEKYSIKVQELEYDIFFPVYDSREAFSAIAGLVLNENGEPVDMEKGQEVYMNIFSKANPFDQSDLSKEELKIKRIYAAFEYASSIMSHLYHNFGIEARTTTYIGPFRENPERVYRDTETQSLDVGVKGENVSTLLIRDYQKNKRLLNEISKWLYSTMGYKLTIKDMGSNLFQIILLNDEGIESNILDVGFGISQVLPIVTQIVRTSLSGKQKIMGRVIDEKTMYIEQPELHLHPCAQSDLADLFVECLCAKPNKKFVIETHSEHFIRKIQVLIANKDNGFTNDMLKIYYVDTDEKGIAKVEEMKILPNGKFEKAWPSGFFDKAHELSMELLRNSSIN